MAALVRRLWFDSPRQLFRELEGMGVDPVGVRIMQPKGIHLLIKVSGLKLKAALILKQEMLAKGGEAALPREAAALAVDVTDALLMGTVDVYRQVIKTLRIQPFGLKALSYEIERVVEAEAARCPTGEGTERKLVCRDQTLPIGRRTLVMGILNVTPDSFSDKGKYFGFEAAVARALEMVEEGADIIDIGGESTRPGAADVPEKEELERVVPVIAEVSKHTAVPISVDTRKPGVAREAVAAGACIINDVTGLSDPEMIEVAAESGAGVIIMHMKGTPKDMQDDPKYDAVVDEIASFLVSRADMAIQKGVGADSIVVDPGIGFGKTLDHNIELIRRLAEFRSLGYPVLIGTSRKSMIGKVLGLPAEERLEGTAATVSLSIAYGADMVRVHDVKEMKRVVDMSDAIVRWGN